MILTTYRCLALLTVTTFTLSCSETNVVPPDFNAERAYSYLVKQVEFGPRVPGSEASAKCRNFFYEHFIKLGFYVDSQPFVFFDPYSKREITLVNVIASYKSDAADKSLPIILMAHYDCRPRADYAFDAKLKDQPIDGANDGASGVAVLMELANLFAQKPPPGNVDIVFVDGEDWGRVGDKELYMLGSREFAKRGIRDKYQFGLVIDMVGDADQQIYREVFSELYHKDINDLVWNTAVELNIKSFHDSVKYTVQDDHLSLTTAGVPAIDIIDFDYPYWHTEQDTPDKCSGESLTNVGRVVAKVIYNKTLRQKL